MFLNFDQLKPSIYRIKSTDFSHLGFVFDKEGFEEPVDRKSSQNYVVEFKNPQTNCILDFGIVLFSPERVAAMTFEPAEGGIVSGYKKPDGPSLRAMISLGEYCISQGLPLGRSEFRLWDGKRPLEVTVTSYMEEFERASRTYLRDILIGKTWVEQKDPRFEY